MSRAAPTEDQPLLGAPGDALQQESDGLLRNLVLGTGTLVQLSILILVALVWAAIFSHPLVPLFAPHPLLNSAALLLVTQSILLLQPTSTPKQKLNGAYAHSALVLLALAAFVGAFVCLFINKRLHNGTHFESVHARIGLVTYILLLVQTLVGLLMFWVPQVFGSVARGKAIWKYHRMSGYAVLTVGLVAVVASSSTDYSVNVLHLNGWALGVTAAITLAGVAARIRLAKFGIVQR